MSRLFFILFLTFLVSSLLVSAHNTDNGDENDGDNEDGDSYPCAGSSSSSSTYSSSKSSSSSSSSSQNQYSSSSSSVTHKTIVQSKTFYRLGIKSFLGINGPAIGSWFRTTGDSTNGHSWCGYPYHDADPLFAPDVTVMLNEFGGDYQKAASAYCGLEAVVEFGGKTVTLFIGDGFSHKWVKTPGSIDITHKTFANIYKSTDNKDVVIYDITWKLTGNRSDKFCFKCQGNN